MNCSDVAVKKRKTLAVAVCVVLLGTALALVCACVAPAQAHASSKEAVQKQVLAIAKKYDKDAFFILKTQVKRGDDILRWWSGGEWFVEAFETMVHEECHGFTNAKSGKRYYVGGKKSVKVRMGKVFRSKKTAKSVPAELRDSRYWIYVGKPSKNLASNVQGVYGLLDEFTAYCWGSTAMLSLFDYCLNEEEQVPEMWCNYAGSLCNMVLAYAEFRYFMEHYLVYAKKHHPRIYKDIMKDKKFRKAIKKVDRRFAKTADMLDVKIEAIANMMRNAGYMAYLEDGTLMIGDGEGAMGYGLSINEYNRFVKALSSKKYKKIEKKLGLKAVKTRAPKLMTEQQAEGEWQSKHPDLVAGDIE